MTAPYDSEYPNMRPGDQKFETRERHLFVVVALNESGLHSGRTKFLVACGSCSALIHGSTTSPSAQFDYHLRNVKKPT